MIHKHGKHKIPKSSILQNKQGKNANFVSDTLPVSLNIMDDNCKQMLKKKEYNQIVTQLI